MYLNYHEGRARSGSGANLDLPTLSHASSKTSNRSRDALWESSIGSSDKRSMSHYPRPISQNVSNTGLAVSYVPASTSSMKRTKYRRRISPEAFLNLLPVLGQIILMSFTWGFWGYIIGRGHIALPDRSAELAQGNDFVVTITTTLVATCLSLFSTFLFSTAVKAALVAHISQPISMLILSISIELSKGIFVFNPKHMKWTISTLICTVALNTMTAGWTTLLQPSPILVSVGVTGTELDLSSPAFGTLLSQSPEFSNNSLGGITSTSAATLSPIMDASGVASASSQFGLQNFINFNAASYNSSTGGILPNAPLTYCKGLDLFPGNDVRGSFTTGRIVMRSFAEHAYPKPQGGFNVNVTMRQQGFSADIKCARQSGDGNARPSLQGNAQALTETLTDPVTGDSVGLVKWSWTTSCAVGNATGNGDFLAVNNSQHGGVVAAGLCQFQNEDGKQDWSTHMLILEGQGGAYSFLQPTVCSITPKVMDTSVEYGPTSINVISALDVANGKATDDNTSRAGVWAVRGLLQRFGATQTLWRNSMGDGLASVVSNTRNATMRTGNDVDEDAVMRVLEAYLRGILEFSWTYMRAGFSAENAFPSDTLFSNMSKPTYGLLKSETIGWDKGSTAAALILMPMTFIALVTALVTMMSYSPFVREHRTGSADMDEKKFDPTNPMHLMIASAGGGICPDTVAKEKFGKEDLRSNEQVMVKLGEVGEGKAGFVLAPNR